MSSATVSPGAAPATPSSDFSAFNQWLPYPSGSSVAWKGTVPNVPSTDTWLRAGNLPWTVQQALTLPVA